MKRTELTFALIVTLAIISCTSNKAPAEGKADTNNCKLEKIAFSLDDLDEKGMVGPADGKVSVDYEFCIPRTDKALVLAIDPEIKVSEGKGRVGCSDEQYLCIGNTWGSDYREVLCRLSALEHVTRIERTMWE